ncbi:MAG: hypothetical protein A2X93_04670, partial [Deltaproteobacteria bacterium GWC2_56_8]
MSKATTPSFILELPLKVSPSQEKILASRLEAARQLYNACLGEALRRLSLLKESKDFRKVLELPKGKEKTEAFKALNEKHGFSEYSLHSFAVATKNSCFIGNHLDTHTTQKVATRAFKAVKEYSFKKRGKPRFKGKGQFDSVESKTNKSGIRFREGEILWSGLELPCIFDPKDKHGVEAHGLSCKTKYVRIVRRRIKGKNLFYAQLVQEGLPKQKAKNLIRDDTVSLDIGPSTVAIFTGNHAELKQFCEELVPMNKRIRMLQRKLDRQRRANNPENYNEDGTIRGGKKLFWNSFNRYLETRAEISELFRRQAEYRKSLHGRLINRILAHGKHIKTEKLSFRAFQKMYGKSIGFRAPGMFMSLLARKAESAGGGVEELNTRKLKLSQTCHCGSIIKKPLSQRWHVCECGVKAQRDLYSAFLGYHVKEDILDTSMAAMSWEGVEPLLQQAVSRLIQSANEGMIYPQSFGLSRRQSGSPVKTDGVKTKAQDVVARKS